MQTPSFRKPCNLPLSAAWYNPDPSFWAHPYHYFLDLLRAFVALVSGSSWADLFEGIEILFRLEGTVVESARVSKLAPEATGMDLRVVVPARFLLRGSARSCLSLLLCSFLYFFGLPSSVNGLPDSGSGRNPWASAAFLRSTFLSRRTFIMCLSIVPRRNSARWSGWKGPTRL